MEGFTAFCTTSVDIHFETFNMMYDISDGDYKWAYKKCPVCIICVVIGQLPTTSWREESLSKAAFRVSENFC